MVGALLPSTMYANFYDCCCCCIVLTFRFELSATVGSPACISLSYLLFSSATECRCLSAHRQGVQGKVGLGCVGRSAGMCLQWYGSLIFFSISLLSHNADFALLLLLLLHLSSCPPTHCSLAFLSALTEVLFFRLKFISFQLLLLIHWCSIASLFLHVFSAWNCSVYCWPYIPTKVCTYCAHVGECVCVHMFNNV